MFELHPDHRITGFAHHMWDEMSMPGTVEAVIAAIFAGEGDLVAQSDSADGRHRGYLCVLLRGFQVEVRGDLEGGLWRVTGDVSVQPLEST